MASFGCGPDAPSSSQTTTSGGTSDGDDGSTPTTGAVDPSTTGADSTGSSSGGSSGGSSDEAGFVVAHDAPPPAFECSLWDEDCPDGMKCMPWAHDGGTAWSATRCSPVVEEPVAIGGACVVEDGPYSGIDDCEAHAFCLGVDPRTLEGVCVGFCTGAPEAPSCASRDDHCAISGGSALAICLPKCSPIEGNCSQGWGCLPITDNFLCAPAGDVPAGEACESAAQCEPGTFCADPGYVGNCGPSPGCCASFCSPADLDPPCLDGQVCDPWDDRVPDVGYCALPQN